MRDLCSVVGVARGEMLHRGHHTPVRGSVASELVGDQPSGFAPLPFQQLAEEPLGRPGVSPLLDQDIDHIPILVDSTPKIVALPVDRDENLVQEPGVTQLAALASRPARVLGAELGTPTPDRLIRNNHSALRQEVLDVPEAQAEAVVQPDGVADDLGWKTVSAIAGPIAANLPSLTGPASS